ncbi:acyl-CoA dehydrogenase [Nocardia pseudovaccinii]|uniref:acyl-CoA dehydrogenase n=1 Tax=Nocardia pseudovaccinii TaxID=189540 RepID=UPI003D8C9543
MGHYKSNVRDLEFNLFEVLDLDAVLADGTFGDLDADTARTMLAEAARQAEGALADSFAETDRNPPTFDPETHSVTLPESYKRSVRAWQAGEWFRVGKREAVGGVPAPKALAWAISEFILGAQPSAYMYLSGPTMAEIVYGIGTEQQRHWAKLAVERNWGATMVLTEPDAGSDVGAGRTRAIQQPDGTWHIEGVKRFITSADSDDLFENIVHQVLARPEGAAPGTKGLSLFLVPKYMFDPVTGEPGKRNGVFVTGLEHKMGLKASATCEVTFGGGEPAVGYLVGDVHNGIAQMFEVIEEARMMVGTKAIATLSTGYLNALEYAKTRVQGADLSRMTDKTAPRVVITHHPDVRRSLMLQKAYAEGMRAVYLYAAAHQDDVVAQHVSGVDPGMAARVNDFLLPIVKGVGSERAYQCLTDSLQTLGGSGFLQDYPLEQYIRDSKIDSLYEGTTAIQAQDFFFRKIARDRGVALAHIGDAIRATIGSELTGGPLKSERMLLATALDDVQAMAGILTGHLLAAGQQPSELYAIGLGSVRFLLAVGDLLIGWRLLVGADTAVTALESGAPAAEKAFYEGKIAAARFFATQLLPELTASRAIIDALDTGLMSVDEQAF